MPLVTSLNSLKNPNKSLKTLKKMVWSPQRPRC